MSDTPQPQQAAAQLTPLTGLQRTLPSTTTATTATTTATNPINPTIASMANRRPTFARNLSGLDANVSGSTDLAGDPKEKIAHHRGNDTDPLLERYDMGTLLGQGSFGKVLVCTDKTTGKAYAAKIIRKRIGHMQAMEQLQREIVIMKKVRHPHIIQLKEMFETPEKAYFVMELCNGGELNKYIRKRTTSEHEVKLILARLADAVAYLHDYGVVHRDIKPENILIQTDEESNHLNIKVSDFGLVAFADNCQMIDNTAGTPFYMAPEVVNGNGYSQQCDVWSIGIIAYLLLCGYSEESERMLSVMVAERKIEYPAKFFANVPASAISLLDMMLQFDSAYRISAREILRHPWLLDISNSNLMSTRQHSMGSMEPLQPTVLRMMRAYNSERKLRQTILAVWIGVRWIRCSVSRRSDYLPSSNDEPWHEINVVPQSLADRVRGYLRESASRSATAAVGRSQQSLQGRDSVHDLLQSTGTGVTTLANTIKQNSLGSIGLSSTATVTAVDTVGAPPSLAGHARTRTRAASVATQSSNGSGVGRGSRRSSQLEDVRNEFSSLLTSSKAEGATGRPLPGGTTNTATSNTSATATTGGTTTKTRTSFSSTSSGSSNSTMLPRRRSTFSSSTATTTTTMISAKPPMIPTTTTSHSTSTNNNSTSANTFATANANKSMPTNRKSSKEILNHHALPSGTRRGSLTGVPASMMSSEASSAEYTTQPHHRTGRKSSQQHQQPTPHTPDPMSSGSGSSSNNNNNNVNNTPAGVRSSISDTALPPLSNSANLPAVAASAKLSHLSTVHDYSTLAGATGVGSSSGNFVVTSASNSRRPSIPDDKGGMDNVFITHRRLSLTGVHNMSPSASPSPSKAMAHASNVYASAPGDKGRK